MKVSPVEFQKLGEPFATFAANAINCFINSADMEQNPFAVDMLSLIYSRLGNKQTFEYWHTKYEEVAEQLEVVDPQLSFVHFDEGIHWFEKILDRFQVDQDMEEVEAIYIKRGDAEKALYWHEKIFNLLDEQGKAIYYFKRGDSEKYLFWLKEDADKNNDYQTINLIADEYEKRGDVENSKLWQKKYSEAIPSKALAKKYFKEKKIEEALKCLIIGAEKNEPDCLYQLGRLFYEGKIVPQNPDKAFNYFNLASAQDGYPEAFFGIAMLYHKDLLKDEDSDAKAFHYALKANETFEDERYLCFLGSCYENGLGTEKDIEKAYEYYEKSFNFGRAGKGGLEKEEKISYPKAFPYRHSNLWYDDCNEETRVAADLISNGKVEEGLAEFERLINDGSAEAARYLGIKYFKGDEIEENDRKAYEYLKKGAEMGDTQAYYYLAFVCLELENDDNISSEESNRFNHLFGDYIRKAAEMDSAEANNYLGGCIYEGDCHDDDAFGISFSKYFIKATMLGFIESIPFVAECYENGYGVEKDLEKALFWYTKGAKLHDFKSLWELVSFYEQGIGVEIDMEKANYWREKAEKVDYPGYVYFTPPSSMDDAAKEKVKKVRGY